MTKPAILLLDSDVESLHKTSDELQSRYERDYDIIAMDSSEAALRKLEELADADRQIAIILAAYWLHNSNGT